MDPLSRLFSGSRHSSSRTESSILQKVFLNLGTHYERMGKILFLQTCVCSQGHPNLHLVLPSTGPMSFLGEGYPSAWSHVLSRGVSQSQMRSNPARTEWRTPRPGQDGIPPPGYPPGKDWMEYTAKTGWDNPTPTPSEEQSKYLLCYGRYAYYIHAEWLSCFLYLCTFIFEHTFVHMWELLTYGRDIHLSELLMCGRDTHLWELLTCGRDIHMYELFTCRRAFTCGSYSHVEGTFMCRSYSCMEGAVVFKGYSHVGVSHMWDEPPKWNSSLLDFSYIYELNKLVKNLIFLWMCGSDIFCETTKTIHFHQNLTMCLMKPINLFYLLHTFLMIINKITRFMKPVGILKR